MKFGVAYQTSERVGTVYMPVGPEKYDIVEINASIGKAPDELIKKK